jgi:hypothetical protein
VAAVEIQFGQRRALAVRPDWMAAQCSIDLSCWVPSKIIRSAQGDMVAAHTDISQQERRAGLKL